MGNENDTKNRKLLTLFGFIFVQREENPNME